MANDLVHAAEGHLEATPPTALEAITRSEIDTQITTAKRYPRSLAKFRQDAISMICIDEKTAASCIYRLPARGESGPIEGPSIRLAEMVAVCWKNIRYGGYIISEDERFVVARGVARDMENNVEFSADVRRRITTRDGRRYGDDMIATTSQAAIAIAVRNAVFKVVPRAFVESLMDEAKKTARGDEKTLGTRRSAMLEYFTKNLKVTKQKVYERLATEGNPVQGDADIGLDELDTLRGWAQSVKDGEMTVKDLFPDPVAVAGAAGLGAGLKAPEAPAAQAAKPAAPQAKPPAPAPQPAVVVSNSYQEEMKQAAPPAAAETPPPVAAPVEPEPSVAQGELEPEPELPGLSDADTVRLLLQDIEACLEMADLTALGGLLKKQKLKPEVQTQLAEPFAAKKRLLLEKAKKAAEGGGQ